MIPIRSIAALLLVAFTCGQLQALDGRAMLQAIAIKEQGYKQGAAGEKGPWQMMPKTVMDSGGSDQVAAAFHLRWIERQLKSAGVDPSPFNCALVWNAGLQRTISGQAKVVSYQYACDVNRIYRSITKQPASLPAPVR